MTIRSNRFTIQVRRSSDPQPLKRGGRPRRRRISSSFPKEDVGDGDKEERKNNYQKDGQEEETLKNQTKSVSNRGLRDSQGADLLTVGFGSVQVELYGVALPGHFKRCKYRERFLKLVRLSPAIA